MKKLLGFLFSVLSLLALCCGFACAPSSGYNGAELISVSGTTIVIRATETSGTLYDALEAFDEADLIDIDGEEGQYGYFIEEINGYKPVNNELFALYTTLGEYKGVTYSDASWGTYEYEGRTLASAANGVSGTPLVEGELYIIALSSY